MNAEIQQHAKRNFRAFIVFEAFWALGMPLTHWVTILPAYLKAIGSPSWSINLMPQATVVLGLFAQMVTLRHLAWRPRRRGPCIAIMVASKLCLLPPALMVLHGGLRPGLLVYGSVTFILLHFLIGSMTMALYYGLMMEVIPVRLRGRLIGIRQLVIGITGLGGAVMSRHILGAHELSGYAFCFLGGMVLSFAGAATLFFLYEPRPDHAEHPHTQSPDVLGQLRHLLFVPLYRRWLLAHLLFIAAFGAVGSVTVRFRALHDGMESAVGMFTMCFTLAVLSTGPLWGWVSDRKGGRIPSLAMMTMHVAAFGLAAALGKAWGAYPVFLLLGMGHSIREIWSSTYPAELFPEENRVRLIAAGQMFASPVALLSALALGGLAELQGGYTTVFVVGAALAVAALAAAVSLPEPMTAAKAAMKKMTSR